MKPVLLTYGGDLIAVSDVSSMQSGDGGGYVWLRTGNRRIFLSAAHYKAVRDLFDVREVA